MPGPKESPPIETIKATVALAITFVAGYVDIIGYISFYDIFTANMTGNTVHLAHNFVRGHWADAALAAAVLAAFMFGSILGRVLIEIGSRKRIRRIASATLLIEASLITLVLVISTEGLSPHEKTWLLVLLAIAMGLQTATLTRVGPLTVHTTFVTGMMNKLAQLLSHGLFLSYDLARSKEQARGPHRRALGQAVFIFSIWLLYFTGAVCGTFLELDYGTNSLALAILILASAIIADQVCPLSLQEEQDQSEYST